MAEALRAREGRERRCRIRTFQPYRIGGLPGGCCLIVGAGLLALQALSNGRWLAYHSLGDTLLISMRASPFHEGLRAFRGCTESLDLIPRSRG